MVPTFFIRQDFYKFSLQKRLSPELDWDTNDISSQITLTPYARPCKRNRRYERLVNWYGREGKRYGTLPTVPERWARVFELLSKKKVSKDGRPFFSH